MSSRVLRKLQGDADLNEELSDNDSELPSGGARKKQLNINRYDMLNQLSHSESEVKEDDNETEANKSCEGGEIHESVKKRKKKKKKKSGKSVNPEKSSEDNTELDDFERPVRGDNFIVKEPTNQGYNKFKKQVKTNKSCLKVEHKHLNPNNELKRIFGAKVIQSEHKKKNRGQRGHVRNTWLVSGRENWPHVSKTGLSMSLLETKNDCQYFTFEHSTNYRQIQSRFLHAVESLNPDNIVAIINDHPYHIDALLQVSDLCKLSEDLAMAAEMIERALYCLECAFHPSFNIVLGTCRLDYRRQQNRAFYVTLFKHLLNVGSRACYRTALEFCKLLLSLDPDGDPLAIKLIIDFYAIRAEKYLWLIHFFCEWESTKNLSQLPSFAFSVPLAHYHLCPENTSIADQLLQNALIMFPGMLTPLLEKCSVMIDPRVKSHSFFGPQATKNQPPALTQLINFYIERNYSNWNEGELLLTWLKNNVHKVLDRVDANDPIVKEFETKRMTRYQGNLPRSIARHIILSDIKGISVCPQPDDSAGGIMSFDPLPPIDTIDIYTRTKRTGVNVSSQSSAIGIFFRSLLPSFNTNENIPLNLLQDLEDEARALPENLNRDEDFRTSIAQIVGTMRNLLSNIRIRDAPVDADVDENDESDDDDDEQNNYLT